MNMMNMKKVMMFSGVVVALAALMVAAMAAATVISVLFGGLVMNVFDNPSLFKPAQLGAFAGMVWAAGVWVWGLGVAAYRLIFHMTKEKV